MAASYVDPVTEFESGELHAAVRVEHVETYPPIEFVEFADYTRVGLGRYVCAYQDICIVQHFRWYRKIIHKNSCSSPLVLILQSEPSSPNGRTIIHELNVFEYMSFRCQVVQYHIAVYF